MGPLPSSLFVSFGDTGISARQCSFYFPGMALRLFFHADNKLARPEILVNPSFAPAHRESCLSQDWISHIQAKQSTGASGVETHSFHE